MSGAEQTNARDHHIRSIVDQVYHIGSNNYFVCNGKGLHRLETTLSIALMQKYVRLRKVVIILAAKRANSYIQRDKTVRGKVR